MRQSVKFDLGEKRHIKMTVKPICGDDIPFIIRNAKWQLTLYGDVVDSGECTVTDHELDLLICPNTAGDHVLKITYEIADEVWVDQIIVEVN